MRRFELLLEQFIFHSRWLLAPFYLGLIVALVVLLAHFFHQLVIFVPKVATGEESEVILGVLNLIDLSDVYMTFFLPTVQVPLEEEGARKIFKLIDALEDSDDVQNVFANFDVDDEVMAKVDA